MSLLQEYDLRNVFQTERSLLTFSGFYPRRDKKYSSLYIFSASVNLLCSYLQLLSMLGQMVVDKNNLSKLTDTLLFFMTHFAFLCKLTNFGYYRWHLLVVEDSLIDAVFYEICHTELLKSKVQSCKLVARIFRILCILCIIFYAVIPCLGEERVLPLPGWLPYDTTKYYYETVFFQLLSICISAYNNSSIDILTWKLITIASAQFDILKENLKNIFYKSGGEDDTKLIEICFKNCVKHHNEIINLVNSIEFIFSKGIFLQFFASVIIICFTGFQMIVVPIPSIEFTFLIMYLSCMMCQVAMYCWYGHDVMMTSDEIGQYCYISNWYESNIEIRKSMIIFWERVKKPVTLTAGNFVTLSLTTLTGILRSSYSYFAVLQRLYKDS